MKRSFTILFSALLLVLAGAPVYAQSSTKPGVIKKIDSSSEKSDNLHGKKIQQQSLSNNQFEKLDSIAAAPVKKKHVKTRRKHQ